MRRLLRVQGTWLHAVGVSVPYCGFGAQGCDFNGIVGCHKIDDLIHRDRCGTCQQIGQRGRSGLDSQRHAGQLELATTRLSAPPVPGYCFVPDEQSTR